MSIKAGSKHTVIKTAKGETNTDRQTDAVKHS